jgi:hypothetical protein
MRGYNTSSEELWTYEEWSALHLLLCIPHSAYSDHTDANANNNLTLFAPTIGENAGADEDDFHTLKRRTAQVEKDEKEVEKAKRTMNMKAGAHSGVIKTFGKPPVVSTKKVVYF